MSSYGDLKYVTASAIHILVYFAAHDDKDILWLTKTLFGLIFPVDYWYWYEAIEGWEVWTFCANVGKFWAQRVKGFRAWLFILYQFVHITAESQNADKKFFVQFMMTALWLTVMFRWKEEGLRVPCFGHILRKRYS